MAGSKVQPEGPWRADFLFFDAGGGHRAAATALKSILEQPPAQAGQPHWQVRLVNLQELLDPLDIFRKITGVRLQDIYNRMLAKGWTLGSAQALKLMQAVIRAYHRPAVKLLEQHWRAACRDMVVSLVPNLNRAVAVSLRNAAPSVPFVTILTDLADFPPHFWIEKESQYIVCGSARAVQQARELGHAPECVFQVSGMILRPQFYQPPQIDRAAERRRLGLDPGRLTALVMFGGQGSKLMLEIARRLKDTQLILICGRNAEVAAALRSMPAKTPRRVEEFTAEVPYYMRLADFFIGKPGPGSISEALAMGLPVIVERNAWTLPQERFNTEWVRERGVGLVVGSFREIGAAVGRMEAEIGRFREAVARTGNRALFEVPAVLSGILAGTSPGTTS